MACNHIRVTFRDHISVGKMATSICSQLSVFAQTQYRPSKISPSPAQEKPKLKEDASRSFFLCNMIRTQEFLRATCSLRVLGPCHTAHCLEQRKITNLLFYHGGKGCLRLLLDARNAMYMCHPRDGKRVAPAVHFV